MGFIFWQRSFLEQIEIQRTKRRILADWWVGEGRQGSVLFIYVYVYVSGHICHSRVLASLFLKYK